MSTISEAKKNPAAQLWEQLEDVMAVMLGSPDPLQHMQPMSPNPEPAENAIWFYTRTDSDLARATGTGGPVHLCLISKDHDYHACMHGQLEVIHSRDHIERYWNSVVSAWYEGGKDDPALTMLRFTPQTGAIWASTDSTLKFGWEIAKANLTSETPDVGYTAKLTF